MSNLTLTAKDEHQFQAYELLPSHPSNIGVVVLQEIFGVNKHIRSVCQRMADEGFHVVAPSMFDRFDPGYESGYSAEEVEIAKTKVGNLNWDKALLDIEASVAHLKKSNAKVATMGFCLGGSLSFLGATRRLADAAVCYYGGRIPEFTEWDLLVPTMCHFGEHDKAIPMKGVNSVQQRYPDLPLHIYNAGHGFNCDLRADYEPESAALAWQRSVDFIQKHCSE